VIFSVTQLPTACKMQLLAIKVGPTGKSYFFLLYIDIVVNCLLLCIGIPAIPDRPLIDSAAGNIIIIRARTSHSGVSDINEDAFQFVFQVVTFCCSIIMAFA
jgi:hypothetical protein